MKGWHLVLGHLRDGILFLVGNLIEQDVDGLVHAREGKFRFMAPRLGHRRMLLGTRGPGASHSLAKRSTVPVHRGGEASPLGRERELAL